MARQGGMFLLVMMASGTTLGQGLPAFPGAEGFGAVASGGRGGAVRHVTTLQPDPDGLVSGSLNWALRQPGPATVIFEVSGVIHDVARVRQSNLTIAGQSSPGGVTVRGLICDTHYETDRTCDNLVVRHLRLRPAWLDALPAGGDRLDDGLRLDGIERFIIDHVSVNQAIDEAVQVSWASDGTIQHSRLGETIGEHAALGGMLLNYSHPQQVQDRLSLHHNLWYRVGGRLPEISCEASALPHEQGRTDGCTPLHIEISYNHVHDPGFLMWYNRDIDQTPALGPYVLRMNMRGNRWHTRPGFPYGMALVDILDAGVNELFINGNRMMAYPGLQDIELFHCCNDFPELAQNGGHQGPVAATLRGGPWPFPSIAATALSPSSAGAWPADPQDRRINQSMASGGWGPSDRGIPEALDALAVDPPPEVPVDTDRDGMPDAFETQQAVHGVNFSTHDANGMSLSWPLLGVAGYTNLEVYLHLRAQSLSDDHGRIFRDGFEGL
jgi:pectate lyase